MYFTELIDKINSVTKLNITQSDIARLLNVGRASIHDRIKRKSPVNTNELDIIQNSLGIKLYVNITDKNISLVKNSKKRIFDDKIDEKIKNIGKKYSAIQEVNDLTDMQMSTLLNISEKDYIKIIRGEKIPDFKVLCATKQNFEISIDDLVFGD